MQKYDVAVVGAGLGGLAVAALLAHQKKKTIVLERSDSIDDAVGVFRKDGFTFSVAPALSYGFEPGGRLHALSANLGIVQQTSVHSPCYQVALPDRRITLYAEWEDTLEELRREYPREIDALTRFYRELHKKSLQNSKSRLSSYLSKRIDASGFIRKYRFSRELMTFFNIQALFFFQKPVEELSIADLITLCDTSPRALHGGFKKLADQLYGIILREGGEISYNEKIAEPALRNDRIIGVTTGHGIVEAGDVLLSSMQQPSSTTLFIGLPNEVVPMGMCRNVLYLPDYAKSGDFISVSLDAEEDASAPPGMRALSATSYSPMDHTADRQHLLEPISALMPFLRDHIVLTEEHRGGTGDSVLSGALSFQPLNAKDGVPMIYRGSRKHLFALQNAQQMPLQALSAAQRFVEKLM